MTGTLRELKRSEEGQALVLAAIFGLVLMLCVLGTVNLGRAVYDKVQLQAAADSAAYSQAAVEARVLNFTAYTNRAMVVHYASMMAATSYLTYIHFQWPFLKALLSIARYVPHLGTIFAAIDQAMQWAVDFLDGAVSALGYLLAANNVALYGLQEGAWWGLYFGRLARRLPPEAHSGDSARHPYQPIWPELIPLANQAVFAQTRGHATMPQNTAESARILLNDKSPTVQAARLHMLEIANSARQPWVAYGDRHDRPSWSPGARHFRWKLIPGLLYGNRARTEMGGFQPGARGATDSQIWSGQQNALEYRFRLWKIRFSGSIPFFTFAAMDQVQARPTVRPFTNSYFGGFSPGTLLGKALGVVVPFLEPLNELMLSWARKTRPKVDYRFLFLAPYVYFAPRASNRPQPGPLGALGNFAQPDVLVGLALEGRDYNQEQGAPRLFGHRFSWKGGSAGRGAVDFRYGDQDWPRIGGLPRSLQVLHKGLNAFAAAQVYYHRPGDWREQPNLFNPLWGARLMPVRESNVAGKLGLSSAPLLQKLLLH